MKVRNTNWICPEVWTTQTIDIEVQKLYDDINASLEAHCPKSSGLSASLKKTSRTNIWWNQELTNMRHQSMQLRKQYAKWLLIKKQKDDQYPDINDTSQENIDNESDEDEINDYFSLPDGQNSDNESQNYTQNSHDNVENVDNISKIIDEMKQHATNQYPEGIYDIQHGVDIHNEYKEVNRGYRKLITKAKKSS